MAEIYSKALVRKDYSGIIEKKTDEAGSGAGTGEGPASGQAHSKNASGAGASERQPLLGGGDAKKGGKTKKKEEDPKNTSGADVGKIVNLMSGDANRLAMTISGAYYIYVMSFQVSLFLPLLRFH